MKKIQIIGIAGGSGGGKTTLAHDLVKYLKGAQLIALDWYYKSREGLSLEERSRVNYDHPEAMDVDLLVRHLNALLSGETILCPQYDFSVHNRADAEVSVSPAAYIVVEGILCLYFSKLRDLFDTKIFVETPDELRFERRLRRDTAERGRTPESVKSQWAETVLPMHHMFVEPSKHHADIVVAGTGEWPLASLVDKNPSASTSVGI